VVAEGVDPVVGVPVESPTSAAELADAAGASASVASLTGSLTCPDAFESDAVSSAPVGSAVAVESVP
jgi:hypothetical protein